MRVRCVGGVLPERTRRVLEFVVQRDEGMDDAWVGAACAELRDGGGIGGKALCEDVVAKLAWVIATAAV